MIKKKYVTLSVLEKLKSIHPHLNFINIISRPYSEKMDYTCRFHGDRQSSIYSLLKGHGCKICSVSGGRKGKERWIIEFNNIHQSTYSYEYVGDKIIANVKIPIICQKHGVFNQLPLHHAKGVGCPTCSSERTNNFSNSIWKDSSKKSTRFDSFKLYILKCWNDEEEFYKIGRTFMEIDKRFSASNRLPYKYKIIFIEKSLDSDYICNKEKQLQRENKKFKYTPKIKFGGYTECFFKIENYEL